MKILIIGANGKVGRKVLELLAGEHTVLGMIRNEEQANFIVESGGIPVLADLENDFEKVFQYKPDIVVFTAGSGSHTGPEKTISVDQEGAIKSIDQSLKYEIGKFIMISAQGAREPKNPSKIQHYFRAKRIADDYLVNSGLPYLIFRPGRLQDGKGEGSVKISEVIKEKGTTYRYDLAKAVADAVNNIDCYNNKVLEIISE